MKFIVVRNNLKEGITCVERISGGNTDLPILKNILIEAKENKIKLTSTDLEVAITFFVNGKVLENGSCTLPAGTFSSLIGSIQSERLNVESRGNRVEIKTDNYEAKIQGSQPDEFPLTPKIKGQKDFIEIKSDIFKDALNHVLITTQFSELRPELNSILLNYSLNSLKIVGTDSFRLAEKTINEDQFNSNHEKPFTLLIPLKTAQELVRVLNTDQLLKIYHDENQVLFKTEQLEFLSRLTEGRFPDYSAIIPKKFDTEIIIQRKEFINSLKLVGILSGKNNEIKLKIKNKKVLELASADQVLGENYYLLNAKISGTEREVTFNWRYLNDVLVVSDSEEVFLGINSNDEPAEIKFPGDASYIYILKPIAPV